MAFLPKSKKDKAKRGGETTPLSSGETTPQGGVKTTLKGMIEPKKRERIETPRKRGVVSTDENQGVENSEANAMSSEGNPSESNPSEGSIAEAIATGRSITDDRMRKRAERPVSNAHKEHGPSETLGAVCGRVLAVGLDYFPHPVETLPLSAALKRPEHARRGHPRG